MAVGLFYESEYYVQYWVVVGIFTQVLSGIDGIFDKNT